MQLPTPVQLAERMKREILADVIAGTVPQTVTGFADLHDYVDANTYGGTEALFGALVTPSETDAEHQAKLDQLSDIMTPAMNIVDAWIKAGGISVPARGVTPMPMYEVGDACPCGKAVLEDETRRSGLWRVSCPACSGIFPRMNPPTRLILFEELKETVAALSLTKDVKAGRALCYRDHQCGLRHTWPSFVAPDAIDNEPTGNLRPRCPECDHFATISSPWRVIISPQPERTQATERKV